MPSTDGEAKVTTQGNPMGLSRLIVLSASGTRSAESDQFQHASTSPLWSRSLGTRAGAPESRAVQQHAGCLVAPEHGTPYGDLWDMWPLPCSTSAAARLSDFLRQGQCAVPAVLELAVWLRLALNSEIHLPLLSAGTKGAHYWQYDTGQ